MLTEIFWGFFLTSVIGLILKCSGYIYKSKCKEVSCCGFKVIRDVVTEETIDALEIERNSSSSLNSNA